MTSRTRIRLPAPVEAAAQAYADEWGLTLTHAVAHLVLVGLAGTPPGPAGPTQAHQVSHTGQLSGPGRSLSDPPGKTSTAAAAVKNTDSSSTAVQAAADSSVFDSQNDAAELLKRFAALRTPPADLADMAQRVALHGSFRSDRQRLYFAGLLAKAEREAAVPSGPREDEENLRMAAVLRERRKAREASA